MKKRIAVYAFALMSSLLLSSCSNKLVEQSRELLDYSLEEFYDLQEYIQRTAKDQESLKEYVEEFCPVPIKDAESITINAEDYAVLYYSIMELEPDWLHDSTCDLEYALEDLDYVLSGAKGEQLKENIDN